MDEPTLHPALEPLAFLLGVWRGEGRGHYPTIEDFAYGEESRFWHTGRPVMAYAQRTWNLAEGTAMHGEMGFWRPQPDGVVEVVLTHTFGMVEMAEARVEGTKISLRSTSLQPTPSAKPVGAEARVLEVQDDVLTYMMQLEAAGQTLQAHLEARLARVSPTA
ncbi:MAG: FABP family protein [Actinomycetota bacterium]